MSKIYGFPGALCISINESFALAAHFEHTIVIMKTEPILLTAAV